jgi:uncharacterized membrane protein YhiD involved in acid resistance
MKRIWFVLFGLASSQAWSQEVRGLLLDTAGPIGEGWRGFQNVEFLAHILLSLLLATVLGAIIAYHPKHVEAADTLAEIDAPKVYIFYAVIGAFIGILVVEYGLVIGFVLFGIGGLMRFRTELASANMTGRVILVTLIGLSAGLDLPHVAVLATIFSFVLIYILESRSVYRIDIRALAGEHFADSTSAYRRQLESLGCRVFAEKKNPQKQHVTFIFSGPRGKRRSTLEMELESGIDPSLKGFVDWETD